MAAALIHRPELFLLDEPFEGVDAVGARLMKEILLEQVRHGATVFLTSHVLEVVERLCDRVAIIHQGKLVLTGTMAELRTGSETLEDVFVRVVGAERRPKAWTGYNVMWNQARAIVWAQWRTARNYIPRSNKAGLIFSGVLLAFWYAGFGFLAVLAGIFLANPDEVDFVRRVFFPPSC